MIAERRTSDVPPGCECPRCGERDADRLVWQDDFETVRCVSCGHHYEPNAEYEYDDDDNAD